MSNLKGDLLEILESFEAPDEVLRRRVLNALQEPAHPRKMTYDEFLAWAHEDTLAEWVHGEVTVATPAGYRHQNIADFLLSIMRPYVEARQLGVVLSAPFQLRLANSGREPDVLFLAVEHLDRCKETYLDGPADLVVEILSPESAARDRGDKFYEYEAAGIPEYWLIDPERERAEFYQLDAQGRYRSVSPQGEGVYRSAVLKEFWLKTAWLWQPPPVLETLRELGLI